MQHRGIDKVDTGPALGVGPWQLIVIEMKFMFLGSYGSPILNFSR